MSIASAKEKLKKDFSRQPDKYYRVKLFNDLGFERKRCPSCGSYFWTLDKERKTCPDPPCEQYSFIGKPPIKSMDYIETWKTIERFFVKNGHESVPSYPVVCRWFPGLFFTVASIVAFQRSVAGKTVFEMPAEKIIIPQVCLRFSDIENVGVTGRHMTNFIMIGQHSIYEKVNGIQKGYWKDTCVELDYKMLTEALGLKPEAISFMEDVWVGPNAFGYSLEYFAGGLELGNAVFTEFVGTPQRYKPMGYRVIDMGAGLERFTWLSQGTYTAYDAVYGPVMKSVKKAADFDESIFRKYSEIAGGLNIDEVKDIDIVKKQIASKLKISVDEMNRNVEPLQALYAIADHTKTLLYSINDGGLLSNVGGGYNLRIIFRRALGFIEKHNLDLDLFSVCKKHAKYLRPLNPDLMKALPEVEEILKVEERRYETTIKKGRSTVLSLIKKKPKLQNKDLFPLYESQGITPELIEKVAEKEKIKAEVPKDFYQELSGRHMKESVSVVKKKGVDVKGAPETKLMFYERENDKSFTAKVEKVIKDGKDTWLVLDRTLFYPEGGGQDFDTGKINGKEVLRVEKFGKVVAHKMDGSGFKEGDTVKAEVDMERRLQHAQHHTGVHVLNGAARKMLGNHVWQAGAGKSIEKAHLDITHYEALTLEDTMKLEELSNDAIGRKIPITKEVMPRPVAEKKHGMRIYQGGAIPDNMVRIVSTKGWDVEACAGTHLSNTSEIGRLVITSSERVQDGVVRLTLKAGKAAEDYIAYVRGIAEKTHELLSKIRHVRFANNLPSDDFKVLNDMRKSAETFSVGIEQILPTAKKFSGDVDKYTKRLKKPVKPKSFNDVSSALSHIFELWKVQKKEMEKAGSAFAGEMSDDLLKKVQDGVVNEIVEGDRKELVKTASTLLSKAPTITIILANKDGEIVVMSNEKDTGELIKRITSKCGGKGGGRGHLAQGIIDDVKKLKGVL
jgi:alanyl-tRNA synthetase